jgi:integrase
VKGGRPHTVRLQGELRDLVKSKVEAARSSSAWLLPGPRRGNAEGSLKRAFPKAVRAAGLPSGRGINQVCFHSLRHSGASIAISSGIDKGALKRKGGWKTDSAMQHYLKMADERLWEVEEQMARALKGKTNVLLYRPAQTSPAAENA